MGRVSGEPHPRCDLRQSGERTASDGWRPRRYVCPRCGAEVVVYVEPLEVRCSCGARMRPSGATPSPVKRKRSEALEVALNA